MYDDDEEEDDEDMDDAGEREEREQHGDALMVDADAAAAVDSGNDENGTSGVDDDISAKFRRSASEQKLSEAKGSPGQAAATERSRRRGTLVDYGHDEAAMSPEPEVYSSFCELIVC